MLLFISSGLFVPCSADSPCNVYSIDIVGFKLAQASLFVARGFNNFGDKRLFEVEQTAVIEKGP